MGKADSERINMRLKTGARFILEQRAEDWGISKTAVIERLLMATESSSDISPAVNDRTPVPTELLNSAVAPATATETGKAPIGFPIACLHCGGQGRGSTKFATICFECKREGHTGDTRECPKCGDYGTGAL